MEIADKAVNKLYRIKEIGKVTDLLTRHTPRGERDICQQKLTPGGWP